ncbi:MAG: hypothetical protein GXO88_14520 [Chlorobi bacterium]|nr:hypothetical protein [Chlorobiota bacterium]
MHNNIILVFVAIIPVLLVLIAVYLMLRYFANQNEKQFDFLKANQDLTRLKLENDRKKDREKVLIPLRLQAYERMVLFLERINPPNMLTREMQSGLNAGQLQALVLKSVREEYEHNMSQQLYIEEKSWEQIKAAKEKIVQLVNTSASQVKPDEPAIKLANEILTFEFGAHSDPIEKAMLAIKNEIKNNY